MFFDVATYEREFRSQEEKSITERRFLMKVFIYSFRLKKCEESQTFIGKKSK